MIRVCLLTHWGRVTHICVTKLTIIGLDNGLSPGRRQAIIWTNAEILLIGALGTNVGEIRIKIDTFSLKKMHLKMSSGKRRPSCLGLNVLIICLNDGFVNKCDRFINVRNKYQYYALNLLNIQVEHRPVISSTDTEQCVIPITQDQ